jgi:hypothetical protein
MATGAVAGAVGAQNAFLLNGLVCLAGGLLFVRALPRLSAEIRPIYRRLGIPPDE